MGWAKYYEDNMSICLDRQESMRYKSEAQHRVIRPVTVRKPLEKPEASVIMIIEDSSNRRQGLSLQFKKALNDSMIKKLQLNGWWWSRKKDRWCNQDTPGNRRYASQLISQYA